MPWYRTASKIVCVGRNYREHAAELGTQVPTKPFFFIKPTSSIVGDGGAIAPPPGSHMLQHEVELAVQLGRRCRSIPPGEAMQCVRGYAIALDMTARDLQKEARNQGLPWTAAKCFDGSCGLGGLVPADELPHVEDEEIWLAVDGEIKQRGRPRDMIFDIPALIAAISASISLEVGDIVLTGTPRGVSTVVPGHTITAGLGDKSRATFHVEAWKSV